MQIIYNIEPKAATSKKVFRIEDSLNAIVKHGFLSVDFISPQIWLVTIQKFFANEEAKMYM